MDKAAPEVGPEDGASTNDLHNHLKNIIVGTTTNIGPSMFVVVAKKVGTSRSDSSTINES